MAFILSGSGRQKSHTRVSAGLGLDPSSVLKLFHDDVNLNPLGIVLARLEAFPWCSAWPFLPMM